jgi:hypothetical protein
MTPLHAYGFLGLGGLLNLLPLLAPGFFPANGLDGANTSALWLQLMGWVNGLIGIGYLFRLVVVPFGVQLLVWRPVVPPVMQPAQILRPAMDFYEEIGSIGDERERGAA